MIVHISLFYLKNKQDAPKVLEALRRVPEQEKRVCTSYVGQNWFAPPSAPGVPEFADVAQVITFDDWEAAQAYPDCPAHLSLRAATDELIQRVCAAEFEQN